MSPAPKEFKREGASRRLEVAYSMAGHDWASVETEIEAAFRENVKLVTGYHREFFGEYAEPARRGKDCYFCLAGRS